MMDRRNERSSPISNKQILFGFIALGLIFGKCSGLGIDVITPFCVRGEYDAKICDWMMMSTFATQLCHRFHRISVKKGPV